MDYKGPGEYRKESTAFFSNPLTEIVWLLAMVLFIALCAYAGMTNDTYSRRVPNANDASATKPDASSR
jgi:hypothetical protein